MKIIIEHSNTKRAIEGCFNVCGDGQSLLALANAILEKVDSPKFYGWVEVREAGQMSLSNTEPQPWDDLDLDNVVASPLGINVEKMRASTPLTLLKLGATIIPPETVVITSDGEKLSLVKGVRVVMGSRRARINDGYVRAVRPEANVDTILFWVLMEQSHPSAPRVLEPVLDNTPLSKIDFPMSKTGFPQSNQYILVLAGSIVHGVNDNTMRITEDIFVYPANQAIDSPEFFRFLDAPGGNFLFWGRVLD